MNDARVEKIQGFLHALQELNQFSNHSATFYFEPLGDATDPQRQVAAFLTRYRGDDGEASQCVLEPISDWKPWVSRSAEQHFFAFALGSFRAFFLQDADLAERKTGLETRMGMSDVVDAFLQLLDAVIGEQATVSVVRGGSGLTWDAIWDAYLVQVDGHLLLLWLGWSD